MNSTIDSIYERLELAQKETRVVLTVEGKPNVIEMDVTSPPVSRWEGRREMDRFLDEGTWQATGPGFQQLREWVEVHWNEEDEKLAPNGTVSTGDDWGVQIEKQLDSVTGTRKLIAAAKLYGLEQVGKFAAEFAAHGMIETHRIFLLKGPPMEAAKPLDKYCMLLPYKEALRRIEAETDPTDSRIVWPECDSTNICALEVRYFECAKPQGNEHRQYTSPLLRGGPEQLALLLGLVWGTGFLVFGNQQYTPSAVAALPYRYAAQLGGSGIRRVVLALKGFGAPFQGRPLAVNELHDLSTTYWELTEQVRSRLARAMARLRDSAQRADEEDKVVDVGVALNILFTEDGEQDDPAMLVPPRAAWHYADSENERRQAEKMLGEFCGHHAKVVRGHTPEGASVGSSDWIARLLADANNLVRACLKTMIAEGRPKDWNAAANRSALRQDPPRTESEIPSVKSDSLSWPVEEQSKIDQALEAGWKPIVEEAPLPPCHVGPSTVLGVLPEIAERHREEGIPYVVPHPARLYMAHPKWPKKVSEPLDDRARYYCEIDVERHLGLWRNAAARKGLVQFEVQNDANLYHPEFRDDWPQPLFSSHEEKASAPNPSHRTASGEVVSSRGSMKANDIDRVPRSAAEEKPTDPPSELPEPVVTGLEREWSRLWKAFQHDVNVQTDSLLYTLEAIHSKHLAERQRLIQAMAASGGAFKTLEDSLHTIGNGRAIPMYPRLRGFPLLTGEPLFRRSETDGPMEQTAFKGWVAEVYDLWESRYRTQLRHNTRELPGSIRPRQQVLGDMRHIRNNLLHNGIAKRGEAGSCEILQWFSEGERMHVRLRHVIDFLNQMGWLHQNSFTVIAEQGKASSWSIYKEGEPEEPTPALISVRPFVDPLGHDPRYRYAASIAFENLVFGAVPMGPENEETEVQAKNRTEKWLKMTVNEQGDLYIPGLATVPADELYWNALKGEQQLGPGLWSPPIQFRE